MKCAKLITSLAAVCLSFPALAAQSGIPNFDALARVEANMGKGCRVAISLPVGERSGIGGIPGEGLGGFKIDPIPKSWQFRSFQKLYFTLTCLDAEKAAREEDTATFDPQSNTWKKDVEKRVRSYGFEMSPQEYRDTYKEQDKAIRVYNIAAVNSKGFVSTVDDTIGDETKRQRSMGFCLFNGPKALCGGGVVAYLADGPKQDLTQHALEILRSIEFLPDAPPAADGQAAPAAPESGAAK